MNPDFNTYGVSYFALIKSTWGGYPYLFRDQLIDVRITLNSLELVYSLDIPFPSLEM